MAARLVQRSFGSGVIDPDLWWRADIPRHASAVAAADNLTLMPQGSAVARPGLRRLAEVEAAGDRMARLFELRFNRDQTYLLLARHKALEVWHAGARATTLAAPWSAAQVAGLRTATGGATCLFLHSSFPVRRLVRGVAHDDWTLDEMPIRRHAWPTRDFGDVDASEWTFSPNVKARGARGTLTISHPVDRPFFSAGGVNISVGTVIRLSGGAVRVMAITGGSEAVIRVMAELTDTNPVAGAAVDVERRLWSPGRGWPSCGCFHAGRLWLGGSPAAPDTVVGSRVNDYWSWDEGSGLDDEAVTLTIGSSEIEPIRAITSRNHLVIATAGAEYAVIDTPITPATASAVPQSSHGLAAIDPVEVEGGLMALTAQRGDEPAALVEMTYSEAGDSYRDQIISLLAGSLLRDPVALTVRTGGGEGKAYHVYVVNGDGTLAVLDTLRSQEVTGWALWSTAGAAAGRILDACVVGSDLYLLTRRRVDGKWRRSLEVLDPAIALDGAVVREADTARTTHPGFAALAGETVEVIADGIRHRPLTVLEDGKLTTDWPARRVVAGWRRTWRLTTLPLAGDDDGGAIDGRRLRLAAVEVLVRGCDDLMVDGQRLIDPVAGRDRHDGPAPVRDGRFRRRRLGRGRDDQVTVSGDGWGTVVEVVREVGR